MKIDVVEKIKLSMPQQHGNFLKLMKLNLDYWYWGPVELRKTFKVV